jgi:hypothetical protein
VAGPPEAAGAEHIHDDSVPNSPIGVTPTPLAAVGKQRIDVDLARRSLVSGVVGVERVV